VRPPYDARASRDDVARLRELLARLSE